MALSFDPEIADHRRREHGPADPGRRHDREHYATADDGAQIKLRWYVKDRSTPRPRRPVLHGGGYIFGHIDLFDGPMSRPSTPTESV